jgi:hypothetical protein
VITLLKILAYNNNMKFHFYFVVIGAVPLLLTVVIVTTQTYGGSGEVQRAPSLLDYNLIDHASIDF